MSKRVNGKLYRIRDSWLEDYAPENLIKHIVYDYQERTGNAFLEIDLKNDINSNDWFLSLWVYNTGENDPDWLGFAKDIVLNAKDVDKLKMVNSSFVLFSYNKHNIFAVTKGHHGHHLLSQYIDVFFGMDILSRLVDKGTTEIRQIEDRGILGVELGAQRYFRGNYNLSYDDDFGKIYKKLLAVIPESSFEKIGIIKKRNDIKRLSVQGGASFEISSKFNVKELIERINRIVSLLQTPGNDLNQFVKLTREQIVQYREKLNDKLYKQAYRAFEYKEELDFYHPDIFDYLSSEIARFSVRGDVLEIPYASSMTYYEIINQLSQEDKIDTNSEERFIESLKNCIGEYQDPASQEFLAGKEIIDWINDEVTHENAKYLKVDNEWYIYKSKFDDYLKKYFEQFNFSNANNSLKLKSWDLSGDDKSSNEGYYNNKYKSDKTTLVADKVIPHNIEICDVIKIQDNQVLLIHVKDGLDRNLRVLSNQITNSARLLSDKKLNNDKSFFEDYYDKIMSNNYKDDEAGICKEDFVDSFLNKEIVFVFAYASSKYKISIRDEILQSRSRVAKLSILYCIKDLRRFDMHLEIHRIQKQ
jgi:uncharacterized protein (TIGR04141 family)